MKIRRFYGTNIRSALRQVTEEFGADAAILSNQKVAGGVEVIAAIDYDESLVPAASREMKQQERQEAIAKQEEKVVNELTPASRQAQPTDTQPSFSEVGLLQSSEMPEAEKPATIPAPTAPAKVEWSMDPSLRAMKEELGMMRDMMAEQLRGMRWQQFSDQDPQSAMLVRRLSNLGLDANIVNSILPHIQQQADPECAWQNVLAIIAKSLPVADNDLLEQGGVFAFMGPTGVGKTTTIAKLAARYVIKHGQDSVALITTDSYRISAQEQLSTFGRILQVPVAKAEDGQSLAKLLKKYSDKRLVLIDTAGISPADQKLMKHLDMLQECGRPVRKLLLMSASCQSAVLQQSLRLFQRFKPDNIVITKLDEATSLGEVLSVICQSHVSVAYTTDGQRVPEDIRVARSHHLVSKAVWLANKFARSADDWDLAQTIGEVKSA